MASNCGNWILIYVPLISHLAPQPLCNLFHNRERNRHVGAQTYSAHSGNTHTRTHIHTGSEGRTHGRDGEGTGESQEEWGLGGGRGGLQIGFQCLGSLSWCLWEVHSESERPDRLSVLRASWEAGGGRGVEWARSVAHLSQSVWTVTAEWPGGELLDAEGQEASRGPRCGGK